jgi:hypothetical protein
MGKRKKSFDWPRRRTSSTKGSRRSGLQTRKSKERGERLAAADQDAQESERVFETKIRTEDVASRLNGRRENGGHGGDSISVRDERRRHDDDRGDG